MKIAEAKEKIMAIANGEYHSIEYKVDDFGNGKMKQECSLYIHSIGNSTGETWEAAFISLQARLNGETLLSEPMPLSKKPTDAI